MTPPDDGGQRPPFGGGRSDFPESGGHSERLPELFLEAQELSEAERLELLKRVESEDPTLAEELGRLLRTGEAAASPIDSPPPGVALPPAAVGPYRIVREVGRGGMGRVFLAEQETPDFKRTVALKIIDRPGHEIESVRRFRDELRILAALEHPNIVRFLDGGKSPEGIWYLALEYVEGDDLVTHARTRGLDLEARVRLVLAVAQAVAFAH